MIVFPNCKINLGLQILNKRSDGYHNLATVFYPVPLNDALEIIDCTNLDFSNSGLSVSGTSAENLCSKAYFLLKTDFPLISPLKIHLHKNIPMGAGLGGGSADAAFMLRLLNTYFQLNLSTTQLMQYALQLGSDCPFFILNKPCLATGRGEILTEIALDLTGYQLVLVNPGIHVNTAHAFAGINQQQSTTSNEKNLTEIINKPVSEWKQELKNDFEIPVFAQYPVLQNIKTALYQAGAMYAAMSGSGSTLFGLFNKEQSIKINVDSSYFIRQLLL